MKVPLRSKVGVEIAGAMPCSAGMNRPFCGPSDRLLPSRGRRRAAVEFPRCLVAAFSLLEVLVAIAILAVGLVTVLGLHAAVVRPVTVVTDAEIAARMGDAIRARLLSLPPAAVRALIQDSAGMPRPGGPLEAAIPAANPRQLIGTRDGEIGVYDAGIDGSGWRDGTGRLLAGSEMAYAIDLVRNEELSPLATDRLSSCVVFTIRIQWPALLRGSGLTEAAGSALPDANRQEVLYLAGSLVR